MLHYLFSYKGRISRRWMWFTYVVCFIYMSLLMGLIALAAYLGGGPNPLDAIWYALIQSPRVAWQWAVLAIYWGGLVIWLYPLGAIVVKRLHDRDKAARWLWLFLGVPMILFMFGFADQTWNVVPRAIASGTTLIMILVCDVLIFWFMLELLFIPGTRGVNRFGPDPRAKNGRIDRPQSGA